MVKQNLRTNNQKNLILTIKVGKKSNKRQKKSHIAVIAQNKITNINITEQRENMQVFNLLRVLKTDFFFNPLSS